MRLLTAFFVSEGTFSERMCVREKEERERARECAENCHCVDVIKSRLRGSLMHSHLNVQHLPEKVIASGTSCDRTTCPRHPLANLH